jgi:predicted metalloprotease
MGYYIKIECGDWFIRETEESLKAVREMPKKFHGIKSGGSVHERWFAWMNDSEIEEAESVEQVFEGLGFQTNKEEGGFYITGYDNKHGQQDLFLAWMAPYTDEGSWMEWTGEDTEMWKFTINEGQMFSEEGVVRWTSREKYKYPYYTVDVEDGSHVTLQIDPLAEDVDKVVERAQKLYESREAHYTRKREEATECGCGCEPTMV